MYEFYDSTSEADNKYGGVVWWDMGIEEEDVQHGEQNTESIDSQGTGVPSHVINHWKGGKEQCDSSDQEAELVRLLTQYADVFSWTILIRGRQYWWNTIFQYEKA